jgi:UDP-glucose 4-epimerase
MKIAILGGGGFIGSAVVDRLLADGHFLRIFERPQTAPHRHQLINESVEWLSGDFMSLHDVTRAVAGVDAVLHLISTTLPNGSNDDMIYDVETNLVGTLQLLGAMVDQRVRKILFISSGGTVYGNPIYLPIDEKHPTEPRVSYGVTKLAIEKYLLLYQQHYGVNAKILRVANPYGERQRVTAAQGAVGVFLSKALRKQPIEVWGDGSVTRDYIHVRDVAEAFARALDYEGPNSVFNIGSGIGTSLSGLIDTIEHVMGQTVERRYLSGRSFDVPVSILDNTLARLELGWTPRIDLEEGIVKTAEWMRQVLA